MALTLRTPHFFLWSLAWLFLIAFCSATHDIAADGFYMLALPENQQSLFTGIRSVCYRGAWLFGQGLMVALAGYLQKLHWGTSPSWTLVYVAVSGLFFCLAAYHLFILPRPVADRVGTGTNASAVISGFAETFVSFFRKPRMGTLLAFLLLYRFGEAQLAKMIVPFLLDHREVGGLGLDTGQVGWVYGTIGLAALTFGGILGGWLVSRNGLRAWLWPIVVVMHVPDAVFIFLSYAQPHSLSVIAACVGAEQFGYGFGFTAYMLYMIYIARGEHATAHYAICTGFMALGLMLAQMGSGKLQQILGYPHFFIWVMLATIPGFIVTALIPLDANFGRKTAKKTNT